MRKTEHQVTDGHALSPAGQTLENGLPAPESANLDAVKSINRARPVWVDVLPARQCAESIAPNMILHAGPPMDLARAPRAFRTAISAAAVDEGLAKSLDEAWMRVLDGRITPEPALDHGGAMGGASTVAANTPVLLVVDAQSGSRAFSPFHEGASPNTVRWGLYDEQTADRLRLFREVLGPVLGQAVRAAGGIDLRQIVERSSAMGDENHSRQLAGNALLLQQLAPLLCEMDLPAARRTTVARTLCRNDRFFLHLWIAASRAVLAGIERPDAGGTCTLQTAMGGNGVEFGIRVAALPGRWFTAPGPICTGVYDRPEWGPDVAAAYFGDSCTIECYGFGSASAAGAPAVLRATGAPPSDGVERTRRMAAISAGTLEWAEIPALDFAGPPVGIDVRKVVETHLPPIIHGGMHHLEGGRAGVGWAEAPLACYRRAAEALGPRGRA